jgi:hypothetical protein
MQFLLWYDFIYRGRALYLYARLIKGLTSIETRHRPVDFDLFRYRCRWIIPGAIMHNKKVTIDLLLKLVS